MMAMRCFRPWQFTALVQTHVYTVGEHALFILCALAFWLHVYLCEGVRIPGTGVTHSGELGLEPRLSRRAGSALNR